MSYTHKKKIKWIKWTKVKEETLSTITPVRKKDEGGTRMVHKCK
jgi:hypothetical protein